MLRIFGRTMVAAALAVVSTALAAAPRLQTGPDAEISHDGLYRVDKTVMDAAWVKPDLDLSGYTKIMLHSVGFTYKAVDNEGKRYNPGRASNDSEFYIKPEGRERIEREMRDAFRERLSRSERYELVTEPGPGVLMLIGGVYDVVSSVPDVDDCVSRCEVFLQEVGQATLAIELRDSMSQEILVRAVDRRAAESAGWPIEVNNATVWAEVRRLAGYWGQRVAKALDDFQSIDDLR